MKPLCITFAGPAGCSKSPVAHYISCEFGLPIMTNDVVRSEVREDYPEGDFNQEEYAHRVIDRIKKLLSERKSFVYDASNDRHWPTFLENFDQPEAYDFIVISFDLSRDFYLQLLAAKKYDDLHEVADGFLADHEQFLRDYADIISCRITDETFRDRLAIAAEAVHKFVADKGQ